MTNSPEWDTLLAAPRHPNSGLVSSNIPRVAGVYAWFQNDECVYVGKASSLRSRLGNHRSTSLDLSRSTLRASVAAQECGVTRAHARQRPTLMTQPQIEVVTAWFNRASVAWVTCADAEAADQLERRLRAVHMPRLNRM